MRFAGNDSRKWTRSPARQSGSTAAFTLLEVIIACAIFFMVAFALLEMVTQGLKAARSLQQREPDLAMVLTPLWMTNKLEEGGMSGDFEDFAPGLYPGYSWMYEVMEVGSNSLFSVEVAVIHNSTGKKGASETHTKVLMFKPGSPPGSMSKGRP